MKKFKLNLDKKFNLYRITALRDFGNVKKGDRGGLVAKETNLSHEGNCWVSGNAKVYGDALVSGSAQVSGSARVSGNALVYGDAWVSGNAYVYDNAHVYSNARVFGKARVFGDAQVSNNSEIINIIMSPYSITITPQNIVVGCQLFSRNKYRKMIQVGKENNLTAKEINYYIQQIKLLSTKVKKGKLK